MRPEAIQMTFANAAMLRKSCVGVSSEERRSVQGCCNSPHENDGNSGQGKTYLDLDKFEDKAKDKKDLLCVRHTQGEA